MPQNSTASLNTRATALLAAIALSLATALPSYAEQSSCPEHFFAGSAPDLINLRLAPKTDNLCYSEFAVKHSGLTRTPLYAAEHLTRQRISSAREMVRASKFFAETRLPAARRAELRMYVRSGYDRGHNAPSADFSTQEAQQECFSLANMVPQDPSGNQGPWSDLESNIREETLRRGDLYVVTGPVFAGNELKQIGGAVIVPTHMFKAVYDPAKRGGVAFLLPNTPGTALVTLSISELEKIIAINLFPAVSQSEKTQVIAWTESHRKQHKSRRR
jgi:endonuclease G